MCFLCSVLFIYIFSNLCRRRVNLASEMVKNENCRLCTANTIRSYYDAKYIVCVCICCCVFDSVFQTFCYLISLELVKLSVGLYKRNSICGLGNSCE